MPDDEYEIIQTYKFDKDCCIVYDIEDEQHVILEPKDEADSGNKIRQSR